MHTYNTYPKMTYLLSNDGSGPSVMKNWLALVCRPLFAMPNNPRLVGFATKFSSAKTGP